VDEMVAWKEEWDSMSQMAARAHDETVPKPVRSLASSLLAGRMKSFIFYEL
jgi:hypothetical protein